METKSITFAEYTRRLKTVHKAAVKLRARYLKKLDRSVSGYINELLWEDVKVRILQDTIDATSSKAASVESISNFANRRLLAMAMSRASSREEMAAWALIVDLANPHSIYV